MPHNIRSWLLVTKLSEKNMADRNQHGLAVMQIVVMCGLMPRVPTSQLKNLRVPRLFHFFVLSISICEKNLLCSLLFKDVVRFNFKKLKFKINNVLSKITYNQLIFCKWSFMSNWSVNSIIEKCHGAKKLHFYWWKKLRCQIFKTSPDNINVRCILIIYIICSYVFLIKMFRFHIKFHYMYIHSKAFFN